MKFKFIYFFVGILIGVLAHNLYFKYNNSYRGPRKADYPVEKIIINRWSGRAMSGEAISHDELMSLLEAARWAPSSYNNQPWRFVYVAKKDAQWDNFFNLLVPANQSWAKNASVLILALSYKKFEHNGEPSSSHSLDTGAALQNLALQGSSMGLVVHTMEGFDYEKARKLLNIGPDYNIEVMVAIGKPASIDVLPKEIQEQEKLSVRKNIGEFAFHGEFKK